MPGTFSLSVCFATTDGDYRLIRPEIYREMGLNDLEYRKIEEILGREPTETELGMFAVMWSEHCGYKYSRPVLSLFKTYREAQAQGAPALEGRLQQRTPDCGRQDLRTVRSRSCSRATFHGREPGPIPGPAGPAAASSLGLSSSAGSISVNSET